MESYALKELSEAEKLHKSMSPVGPNAGIFWTTHSLGKRLSTPLHGEGQEDDCRTEEDGERVKWALGLPSSAPIQRANCVSVSQRSFHFA